MEELILYFQEGGIPVKLTVSKDIIEHLKYRLTNNPEIIIVRAPKVVGSIVRASFTLPGFGLFIVHAVKFPNGSIFDATLYNKQINKELEEV